MKKKFIYGVLKIIPLLITTMLLSGCVDEKVNVCGDLINDRTISLLPSIDYFQIISYNATTKTVILRYNSDKFEMICTRKNINSQVNITGHFNNVSANIWWAQNKNFGIPLNYTPSLNLWTGVSEWINLSDDYPTGPGRFWITVDFSFQFIGNTVDINNAYAQLAPLFMTIYINPDAYKYID